MKGSGKNFNNDFEEAWQHALEGAEVTPPEAVWDRIDGALLQAETLRYKKYYLFYRSVAAAAVLLLAVFGTWAYFNFQGEQTTLQPVASTERTAPGQIFSENGTPNVQIPFRPYNSPDVDSERSGTASGQEARVQAARIWPIPGAGTTVPTREKVAVATSPREQKAQPDQPIGENIRATEELVVNAPEIENKPGPADASNSLALGADLGTALTTEYVVQSELNILHAELILTAFGLMDVPGQQSLSLPPAYIPEDWASVSKTASRYKAPQKTRSVDLRNQTRFYASLNLQSDFFQPNFQMAQSMQQPEIFNNLNISQTGSTRSFAVNEQLGMVHQPVPSFTYGMNMGMRITGNLILEGGVAYANFNTNTATRAVIKNMDGTDLRPITIAHTNASRMNESVMLDLNTTHALNNMFEFASLPLRAGYVISARNLHFILKAGIATDFFIRSELSSSKGRDFFDPMTQNPGDQSPFRRVFWNGSVGNEVNYSLNRNYSFSLEANYRFAMQPLTKSGEAFSSLPESYGIGMAFRYHFN
jgi:hypothetical protein